MCLSASVQQMWERMASLPVMVVVSVALVSSVMAAGCRAPFVQQVDESCLHVVVSYQLNNQGAPVSWAGARSSCRKVGGDLVVLDSHEKLQVLSRYLDTVLPEETKAGYIYWVGGYRVGRKRWRWVDGSLVDLKSHIWTPSRPTQDNVDRFTILVPVDQVHHRRYLLDYETSSRGPGFVCEWKERNTSDSSEERSDFL
ncbi:hypothetical protein OTU49_009291 [Cherax quadricarinatus]|uniref:C-type lectin domain-containing protein n=1 Tax=Cherax quadricarinatus TaxID=27406 RepID=A0AAW0Y450_CHEQU|nr:uncharacterized protein LOC128684951 [Cherax quadricarinatus]